NTQLMSRGRAGHTTPTLLIAERQTAGRGRQGRPWQAQAGDSLTFSLGLPLQLDAVPGGGSALSLAVGLALAEGLDAGLRRLADASDDDTPLVHLKWPNDLWWQGRKLGGILIEATTSPGLPAHLRWVVIGVGLNLRPLPEPLLAHASLQEASPHPLSAGDVLGWIGAPLLRAVKAFEQDGFAPLQTAYALRDALAGQAVSLWEGVATPALQGPPSHTGQSLGVDAQGALLVHTDTGLLRWTTG